MLARYAASPARTLPNAGIAKRLWLTEKTVETHVSSILGKLGLSQSTDDHRRVLAVLTYLRATVA